MKPPKAQWRLEHLPPATQVLVTGFLAGVAGYLDSLGSAGCDFRATLHRTLYVGDEATLQQAAKYDGNTKREGSAARTFGFNHASVGYAAVTRKSGIWQVMRAIKTVLSIGSAGRRTVNNTMPVAVKHEIGECPRCSHVIAPSRQIFRKEYRCPKCGARLYVSVAYLRSLFVGSAVIGIALAASTVGIQNVPRPFIFGIPLGFMVLMVLVRVAPYLRMPLFLLRDPDYPTSITTLDLMNGSEQVETGKNPRDSL
jgi:predicted RNA-binding Zn-ribbon protein involved in translation (DUF1610 family)